MALRQRLVAWGFLGLAVFLAVAFVTFDPCAHVGEARPLANLAGPAGAFLAAILVESFGVGAFLASFFFVFLAWLLVRNREVEERSLKILGLFLTMVTFGAFCQALLPERAFPKGAAPLGGVLGDTMAFRLSTLVGRGWAATLFLLGTLSGVIMVSGGLIGDALARRARAASCTTEDQRRAMARALEATVSGEPELEAAGEEPAADAAETVSAEPAAIRYLRKLKALTATPRRAPLPADPREEQVPADEAAIESWDAEETPEEVVAGDLEGAEEDEETEYEEGEDDGTYAEDEAEDGEYAEDEGDGEYAEDEEADEEEYADEEEEEPEAEEEVARPQPRIRQAVPAGRGDQIAVIRLARDRRIKGKEKYELPPLSLLDEPRILKHRESEAAIQGKARALEEVLADFGVSAQVTEIEQGPVITRYDLVLARGTKISKVTGLADDVAMALGAMGIRIAPVKGRSVLGVEIPNQQRQLVNLRDVASTVEISRRCAIPLFLGKDTSGHPLVEDLATTPHLLIAGRTGAGKSVFVNSLVLSILLTRYPEEVRLIMIDPKKVELEIYQHVPHLLTQVESNPKKATKILEWAVNQMEERYELLAATGVRHLTTYNKLSRKDRRERLAKHYSEGEIDKLPEHLPYVVIIVDELADLMMVSGKEVEQAIARLAQKARAVGIHVVLATQRPSTDVITGLIKSNLPARIAFQTRTGIDSRTIIDRYGAEKLLDRGDMLYLSATSDIPRRIQGPFVSDEEVERVVAYLKEKAAPFYTHHLEQVSATTDKGFDPTDRDELFEQAVEVVMTTGQASASFLQRRMSVGYARASRLIDLMSEAGIVSEHRGSKVREILISPEQWEEMRQEMVGASTAG